MTLGAPRRSPWRPRPDASATRKSMTTPKPWRARLGRAWPVARYAIGLALAPLAFEQLVGHKSEFTEATLALSRLRWGWVLLGVAAEAGSFLAFAEVQRRLLRAGLADVAIGPTVAITLAANSITNSLPAGSVIARCTPSFSSGGGAPTRPWPAGPWWRRSWRCR
jgi:hypothetical protein